MTNTENLELKVGELVEVSTLKLPLVAETEFLNSHLDYDKNGLKLVDFLVNKKGEGGLNENRYVFETIKEGEYSIHLYFKSINSGEQWIPEKQSSFYGRHEKIVKVNVLR
ncbi:hypothetical protein HY837_03655 [archaeon]|nr:hypothetical protein [archaeon]